MFARLLSELRHRWRAVAHRDRMEHELDAELRFHLEREAAKLESRGMAPAEAARRPAWRSAAWSASRRTRGRCAAPCSPSSCGATCGM